jgi:hypothetical protein
MSHPHVHAPELPYCRNCHFTLASPRPVYCGHCGQETDLHPPSVREMFTEYLGHYVAFDGPLWRTLWALICLPGHLTNAYFHGRRRRYVLPLRVYLSASFLFFVGSALLPDSPVDTDDPPAAVERSQKAERKGDAGKSVRLRVKPDATPAETAAAAEAMARVASAHERIQLTSKLDRCAAQPDNCSASERLVARGVDKASSMTRSEWTSRARALAPYGMLAMQPVFAAVLLGMFAGSGRRYAEHFVFSLHSHSLWFLALLIANAFDITGLMVLLVFGHGLLALRRVYGLSTWGALWRGLLLSSLYFVMLAFVALSLTAFIVATS